MKKKLATEFVTAKPYFSVLFLAALLLSSAALAECARTLMVGPEHPYAMPSDAAREVRDGDCVKIDAAGVYNGDVARWNANNLHIQGYNGRPTLRANGKHYGGKALWVIAGDNTTIEYVEISGVSVPDKNGAAIRLQGRGLVLRRVYLHHNEAGLLTSNDRYSRVLIEGSEIAHNGYGDGYSHNIYIGTIAEFELRFSYIHHAVVGHNVKSRARSNRIRYNRIMDEYEGKSSYLVDIPFGGYAEIMGNLFQQARSTKNKKMLAYGAENLLPQRRNELYVVFNTFVNDLRKGGVFVWAKKGEYSAVVGNNLFYGRGKYYQGPGSEVNNLRPGAVDMPRRRDFDYRLGAGAVGVGEAIPVETKSGKPLLPEWSYRHRAQGERRAIDGTADIGAYELRPTVVYGRGKYDWFAGRESRDAEKSAPASVLEGGQNSANEFSNDEAGQSEPFSDQPVWDSPIIIE